MESERPLLKVKESIDVNDYVQHPNAGRNIQQLVGLKYEGYYLLEVFLIGGNLTELCLYVSTLVLLLLCFDLNLDVNPVLQLKV